MQEFSWDERKASANFTKHEVTFAEASSVFFDMNALTELDEFHSDSEIRYRTTGFSERRRVLVVVHSDYYDTIRIISAWRATANEALAYANTRR